jgi:RND family efflux transporter MFP subunit
VARRQATVSAEVTGRVTEVRVEEGQAVKSGEILGVLDATLPRADFLTAQARLASNEAQIAGLQSNIADARRIAGRAKELAERGLGTRAAADTSATNVSALEAQIRQAQAQANTQRAEIERIKSVIDRYTIRAPFDGVVTTKAAQVGEIISPASAGGGFTRTGLCTLVDMASLEIEVDVNESFIARVKDGMPVEAVLDAYPDDVFPARVIATIPTASRDRATVRVRVGFDSIDPRILPEMAIKVTFVESQT